MKKKFGFFGGAFNPPTKAHIELAKNMITTYQLDQLFFVPVGNQYDKPELTDEKHRYRMLQLITNEEEKLDVSDIELNTNQKLKAIDVFHLIQEEYKDTDNFYILGSDNFERIVNWKNAEELVSKYKLIVLNRGETNISNIINKSELLSKNANNILYSQEQKVIPYSSTLLRKAIQKKDNDIMHEILPTKIEEYIEKNKLYQKNE